MKFMHYKISKNIPVHFFGESKMINYEWRRKKKILKCMSFLSFCLLETDKTSFESFDISAYKNNQRIKIQVFQNKALMFEIIEDCLHEWVIKFISSEKEVFDSAIEFITCAVSELIQFEEI